MSKLDINRELLERYELGQCTDQEQAMVRQWLEGDVWDLDDTDGPSASSKIKTALWTDISSQLDDGEKSSSLPSSSSVRPIYQRLKPVLAIAASIIALLGIGFYSIKTFERQTCLLSVDNTSADLKRLTASCFDISLSENSSADINLNSKHINVSGNVRFAPKSNFVLYDKRDNTPLDFKQGEVYYMSSDPDTSKLIVFTERELRYLSPIIQKHIRKQFYS